MNTAERLVAIAEKSQAELNAVRGMNEELEGVLNGTGAGGVNQYDAGLLAFLNMLSNNNSRKNYYGAFASSNLDGYTFPYTIKPGDIGRMFYVYVGKKMPKNIDFSQATESTGGYYQTFCWADILEEIYFDAPAPTGQYNMTFSYCRKVKKVDRINVLEQTTFSQAFLQCYELEEITIGGVIGQTVTFADCPLNKESIENIIGALSESASGKTLTLKLTAVQKAFETSEGANDGNTSGQWLALAATKSNWTITLA